MKKLIVKLLGKKPGKPSVAQTIVRIFRDEAGGSAAEYALIVAVVGLGIGAASLSLGANIGAAGTSQSKALYDMNFAP